MAKKVHTAEEQNTKKKKNHAYVSMEVHAVYYEQFNLNMWNSATSLFMKKWVKQNNYGKTRKFKLCTRTAQRYLVGKIKNNITTIIFLKIKYKI
jgi:hypothetical protein